MDSALFKKFCLITRNAAPEEWDAFVKMFEAYTQEAVESVVFANKDVVSEAQGAAKLCRHILHAFKTCDQPPASP